MNDIYSESKTASTFNMLLEYRWHTGYPQMFYGQIALENDLIKNLNLKPGSRVLDFGSGNCIVTGDYCLMKPDCTFYAVNRTVDDLKWGQNTNSKRGIHNIQYKVADGEKHLPFISNFFDAIIFTESVCHVRNKDNLFREFYRILKPGGRLTGSDWHMNNNTRFLKKINQAYGTDILPSYQELLQKNGFKNFKSTSFYPINNFKFSELCSYPFMALKYSWLNRNLPSINPSGSTINPDLITSGYLIERAAKQHKFWVAMSTAIK